MYCKHHTKGIIISGKVEGNDSRRVNIFTENFGLLSAKVQGSRNIHSKLRNGSQDFSFGQFSLVHGKSGWRVVSVRTDKNFYEIFRNSSAKLKIASNIFNLIKKLVSEESQLNNEVEHQTHSTLFRVVSNFLNFLITAPDSTEASLGEERNDIALAECLTLMRVLHSLGYMRHDPELLVPMSSVEINIKDLEAIAPRRSRIVKLINESLKAT